MTGGAAGRESSRIDNDQCNEAEPIACSLSTAETEDRLSAWAALLGQATERHSTAAGERVRLPAQPAVAAQAAELAALEADCCRFFTFTITVGAGSLWLEVEAPPEGRPLLDALFT